MRRYGGLVAARIRRVVGPAGPGAADEALVEDLSQEAFLRAFRALDRYERRDDATLATWLATIATRVAIDALRRRRPEVLAGPVAHALEHAVDERERADEALARGELRRALDRAFAQLPPALAEVFRLSALEGRPCAAIAAAQGCPVGTVKSRLARARQRLRRALRAQGAGLPAR